AANAGRGTIPIVFLGQAAPINCGFVASFNRPGGNATGMALLTAPLVAKRLEIVLQLAPVGAPVGYLMNPQDTREAGDYLGGAIKSSHWRHAIAFPPSTIAASLL